MPLPDDIVGVGLFVIVVALCFTCYRLGRHNLATEIGLTREEYENRTKGEGGI